MHHHQSWKVAVLWVAFACLCWCQGTQPSLLRLQTTGNRGGRLVYGERAEPKTLNPVLAMDSASRDVIQQITADLIHINRQSQQTEPGLAESWTTSPDGRRYLLRLRHGVNFSDGQPFTADDVVFTFRVYLDESLHSPQRDLLVIGGKPIVVRKMDDFTVEVSLAQPYAAGGRLFDGIAILPQHLLRTQFESGGMAKAWPTSVPPEQIAGLGPFRFKSYAPGQQIVLERNPHYWKADARGQRLPYLDSLLFLFSGNEEAAALRFQAGEIDVLGRLSPKTAVALERDQQSRPYRLFDLGPSLDYNFLLLNQNSEGSFSSAVREKQEWFRNLSFRQALSAAIDRDAVVRLAFAGRATPIWGNVSPGNKLWVNTHVPKPPRAIQRARKLLSAAGFSWREGSLEDARGRKIEFSILTSASSPERTAIATIVQQDLKDLGISAQVVTLEFRAFVDRLLRTHDYEACIMGLGGGDADPNSEMNVWLSNGSMHLWNVGQKQPATPWEAEVDKLMNAQLLTLDYKIRKRQYDAVQQIIAEYAPMIFIVSPNVLVAAKTALGNFRPAVLGPHSLWNAEELYWREKG